MNTGVSSDKPSSNNNKQKLQSGTISKVISDNFEELSTDDLNSLWQIHNDTIKELEGPQTERYTRYTSDLIKRLRDVSEKLISAKAIPDYTSRKDTASYVWKQLKDRNIPYAKANFYKYFSEEQKRDYQNPEILSKAPDKSHKHDFSLILGNFEGVGEIRNCAASGDVLCQAKMIDGQIYENVPDPDSDTDLTKKPKRDPIFYEDENQYVLNTYQKVIDSLKSVQQYYIRKPAFSELNEKEKRELREVLLYVEKATEFVNAAFNDKNKIPTMTEHLLVLAYAEETQNAAGGLYLSLFRKFGAKKVEHAKDVLSKYLTSKQTLKKMRGKTPKLHPRYDPKNRVEAEDRGFDGMKCSNQKCPSFGYRIDYDQVIVGVDIDEFGNEKNIWDTKLVCFACNTIQKPITIKLEKMHRKVVIDYSKIT